MERMRRCRRRIERSAEPVSLGERALDLMYVMSRSLRAVRVVMCALKEDNCCCGVRVLEEEEGEEEEWWGLVEVVEVGKGGGEGMVNGEQGAES